MQQYHSVRQVLALAIYKYVTKCRSKIPFKMNIMMPGPAKYGDSWFWWLNSFTSLPDEKCYHFLKPDSLGFIKVKLYIEIACQKCWVSVNLLQEAFGWLYVKHYYFQCKIQQDLKKGTELWCVKNIQIGWYKYSLGVCGSYSWMT